MSNPEYRDLTDISHMSGLGLILCKTSGFPPTSVMWKKDNSSVNGDSSRYQAMQKVVNRASSSYNNILIIFDVLGILGNVTYTCSVRNPAGEVSRDIQLTNKGISTLQYLCV